MCKLLDGASPSIVLAYYPSPSGSPSVRSPSDTHGDTLDAAAGPAASVPYKKRLTARTTEDVTVQEPTVVVEKIGTKGQVTVVGKRVSCKMCRCVVYSLVYTRDQADEWCGLQTRTRGERSHSRSRPWHGTAGIRTPPSRHDRLPSRTRASSTGRDGSREA
jgi:hypothetical protein